MNTIDQAKLKKLIGEYWDIGFEEGASGSVNYTEAQTTLSEITRTIDALVQGRDAEIERLKDKEDEADLLSQLVDVLNTEIAAQRKVLEQALEAFTETISMYLEWHKDFPEHVGDKEKPVVQLALAAITAIQGILPCASDHTQTGEK